MLFIQTHEMKISVTKEQESFLSSKESICKALSERDDTMAYDIIDGNDIIGFVMIRRFEKEKYFLWDFAIDARFQNRHLGTKALLEFIEYMKANLHAKVITTTYISGNNHARYLYEKAGFMETDVVDEDCIHEVNMAYIVT